MRVHWALQGGRRFEVPLAEGPGPFEGCEILRFAPGSEGDLRTAVDATAPRATRQARYAGTLVYVFREKPESPSWTWYLSNPAPGILIVGTHSGYVQDVLSRMQRRARQRAFPGSLPEWRHVDTWARAWGIRHYRRDCHPQDRTSPYVADMRGGITDAHAIGFTFSLQTNGMVSMRYLSEAADPFRAVRGKHMAFAALEESDVHPVGPGVVGCELKAPPESAIRCRCAGKPHHWTMLGG